MYSTELFLRFGRCCPKPCGAAEARPTTKLEPSGSALTR